MKPIWKMHLLCWLKRMCIRYRYDAGYRYLAPRAYKAITDVYGKQSDHAW